MSATTILIGDDDDHVAIMNAILTATYTLGFTRNGSDALAAGGKHRPAMELPDTDGYQRCRQIKERDPSGAIQVNFITACRDLDHEARGFDAGCVDYIVKPVSPPIVRARVAARLARVRAGRRPWLAF